MSERNNIVWLDNAKILATVAVIFLHVSGGYLSGINDLNSPNWWTANIYNSLVRWCVPVFVMVSGYLLLDPGRKESSSEFYKKRASRVLIPLVVWTLFYLLWLWVIIRLQGGEASPGFFVDRVLSGTPYYHMWFLYMITGLYLFTPFLRKLVKQSSNNELVSLCVVLFVLSAINYANQKINQGTDLLFINWFLFYLPYYFAGYLIGSAKSPKHKMKLAIVFILSIILTITGCFLLGENNGIEAGKYFYGYLSITVIPMSLSLFFLLKDISKPLTGVIANKNLAQLSLGIYLIHPILIDLFPIFGISARMFNPVFSIPLVTVLVFGVTLMVTQIIQAIPYIKRVI